MRFLNKYSLNTRLFIGLLLIYLVVPLLLPANHLTTHTYNLSVSEYHTLLLIVRLPIIAVWCLAFYAYRRLTHYAEKIADTQEGEDFATIARGMAWIVWGLLGPSMLSMLLSAITNSHPGFKAASLIITNYAYVVVAIAAFAHMSTAAQNLATRAKVFFTLPTLRLFMSILVICGVIFCSLIASRLHNQTAGDSFNAYYLPNWLVWSSIVIPYVYAWCLGLYGAMELILLSQRTSGIIYRQALQLLAFGLVVIILAMSGMQYLRSIIPRQGRLEIGPTLIAAYTLYAFSAVGYVLVVNGSRKLKQIEDI